PELHMTGADCGPTASRAGARRLVLTHVPPWYDPAGAEAEARGEWSGPVDLARAGARYDVGGRAQTSPASCTTIATCTRLVASSLVSRRDTCAFTVGIDR